MQGLQLEAPRRLAVTTLPRPVMGEHRLLISIEACTVCGGDLKVFSGHAPHAYPHVMVGHELVGTVAGVGSEVHGYRKGDIVAFVCGGRCGTCPACRSGHASHCIDRPNDSAGFRGGGFAETVAVVVPPAPGHCGYFVVPEDLDPLDAVVAEPAACALGALERSGAGPGDWLAIVGLGSLGMMMAQAAAAHGVRAIGIDIHPGRRQLASAWCEATLDPESDVAGAVAELTGGVGVDAACEVVGRAEALASALALTRVGGVVVLVGVHVKALERFHPESIFRRGLTIVSSKGPKRLLDGAGQPRVFDALRRGLIQPHPLLRHFALEVAQQAFEEQLRGDFVKAALIPATANTGSQPRDFGSVAEP